MVDGTINLSHDQEVAMGVAIGQQNLTDAQKSAVHAVLNSDDDVYVGIFNALGVSNLTSEQEEAVKAVLREVIPEKPHTRPPEVHRPVDH